MESSARSLKCFLSYRRNDLIVAGIIGRIFDKLVERLGEGHVFMDVDSIPPGADFRVIIDREVSRADIVLVLIGNLWTGIMREKCRDPGDYVRAEIESALARGIPIVPVLIGNASMPRPEELPPSLRQLSFFNAAQIDPGRDFHVQVSRLISDLTGHFPVSGPFPGTEHHSGPGHAAPPVHDEIPQASRRRRPGSSCAVPFAFLFLVLGLLVYRWNPWLGAPVPFRIAAGVLTTSTPSSFPGEDHRDPGKAAGSEGKMTAPEATLLSFPGGPAVSAAPGADGERSPGLSPENTPPGKPIPTPAVASPTGGPAEATFPAEIARYPNPSPRFDHPPLMRSRQIILGIAEDWDSSHVELAIFERSILPRDRDGPLFKKSASHWTRVGPPWRARLGHRGLAWGIGFHPLPAGEEVKREGDGRSPCGIFDIGVGAWGYADSVERNPLLPYHRITSRSLWCEDVSSPAYNSYLLLDYDPRTPAERNARMLQNDHAQSLKLFIAHNYFPAQKTPGLGSAIFFHIWRSGGEEATLGSTAMSEPNLRKLIGRIDPSRHPRYVLLPLGEYRKRKRPWNLP